MVNMFFLKVVNSIKILSAVKSSIDWKKTCSFDIVGVNDICYTDIMAIPVMEFQVGDAKLVRKHKCEKQVQTLTWINLALIENCFRREIVENDFIYFHIETNWFR